VRKGKEPGFPGWGRRVAEAGGSYLLRALLASHLATLLSWWLIICVSNFRIRVARVKRDDWVLLGRRTLFTELCQQGDRCHVLEAKSAPSLLCLGV